MKFVAFASLISAASAFTAPTMTFAVGKKGAPKKAATTKPVVAKAAPAMVAAMAPPAKKAAPATMAVAKPAPKAVAKPVVKAAPKPAPKPVVMAAKPAPKAKPVPKLAAAAATGTVASIAIPGEQAPSLLTGKLVGDVGFDPCFLSTKADSMTSYFNGIVGNNPQLDGLTWYREAELIHGRICMLAVVGFIAPGFGTLPGDAYSATNPLEALGVAPGFAFFQILAFMSFLEFRRIGNISKDGSAYMAGDSQKWGQGEGRWNPLGLNYTPEQYEEKQLQELKHGRLAMIGFLGVLFQANASGVSVVDQLSAAFVAPDYYAKAGYFMPEGI